jgi:predicted amidohydrolase
VQCRLSSTDRQYLAWLDTAIFEHLGALARQHRIAIVGSVLTGIVPAELQLPAVPSVSPFEHLLTGPVAGSGVTRAQKDWAAWVSDYKAVIATDFRPVVKNTAFFIDETGELTGRYDKRNLWHPER